MIKDKRVLILFIIICIFCLILVFLFYTENFFRQPEYPVIKIPVHLVTGYPYITHKKLSSQEILQKKADFLNKYPDVLTEQPTAKRGITLDAYGYNNDSIVSLSDVGLVAPINGNSNEIKRKYLDQVFAFMKKNIEIYGLSNVYSPDVKIEYFNYDASPRASLRQFFTNSEKMNKTDPDIPDIENCGSSGNIQVDFIESNTKILLVGNFFPNSTFPTKPGISESSIRAFFIGKKYVVYTDQREWKQFIVTNDALSVTLCPAVYRGSIRLTYHIIISTGLNLFSEHHEPSDFLPMYTIDAITGEILEQQI